MLHKNVLQHIFNEGIYYQPTDQPEILNTENTKGLIQGNQQADVICVLLSETAHTSNELELLEKILTAIQISKDEYSITNQWSEALKTKYKHVFIFSDRNEEGISHLPLNKFHLEGANVFKTFGLSKLIDNNDLKRELWQAISGFRK